MRVIDRRAALFGFKNIAAGLTAAMFSQLFLPQQAAGSNSVVHNIEIANFTFSPQVITVRPGDTIVWTNRDIAPHTATAQDNSWDTGTLEQNETASIVVTSNQTGDYTCQYHPGMKASLTISSDE